MIVGFSRRTVLHYVHPYKMCHINVNIKNVNCLLRNSVSKLTFLLQVLLLYNRPDYWWKFQFLVLVSRIAVYKTHSIFTIITVS
jgi:hypothetical protein